MLETDARRRCGRTESISSEAGRRAKGPVAGRGTGAKVALVATLAALDRVASSFALIEYTTLCGAREGM